MSLLLHPLDFLGADDQGNLQGNLQENLADTLSFFPAMNVPRQHKLSLLSAILGQLGRACRIVPLHEHARSLQQTATLALVPGHAVA